MQIKVEKTRIHSPRNWDECRQGKNKDDSYPVVEAKLVLIDCDCREGLIYLPSWKKEENNLRLFTHEVSFDAVEKAYNPILISETEKIEIDDYIIAKDFKGGIIHMYGNPNNINYNETCYKILALPEHFSPKHLQAIVDGKMKDGDSVIIECVDMCDYDGEELWEITPDYIVKLNSSNHITLHKVEEKMYTREQVSVLTYKLLDEHNNSLPDVYSQMNPSELDKYHKEWFEQNVK